MRRLPRRSGEAAEAGPLTNVIDRQPIRGQRCAIRAISRRLRAIRRGTSLALIVGSTGTASRLPYVQGEVVTRCDVIMSPNRPQDTYTMPLKQLLKLLETTADAPASRKPRPRRRHDPKPAAPAPQPEPEYFRF